MSEFMSQNAQQLMNQNKVIQETMEGVRSMMDSLKRSVEAIEEAENIRGIQSGVIQGTVEINEDIAGRIRSENEEFTNIASMVQSNRKEIMELSAQVDTINSMVEELEKFLHLLRTPRRERRRALPARYSRSLPAKSYQSRIRT